MPNKLIGHLHIEINPDLEERLIKAIPWGLKRKLVEVILYQLVEALEGESAQMIIAGLLTGHLDIMKKYKP